jgi:hypothetical protein
MRKLAEVVFTGVLLGLSLGFSGEVVAAPQSSCEAWQDASRQQLAGEEKWHAALVHGDDVQVYAAPSGVCGCPGMRLQNSMAVYAYRAYHGFTRVLYLDLSSGRQISGWVRSSQLRQQHGLAAI